jgi:predicted RNase H-like nuclease
VCVTAPLVPGPTGAGVTVEVLDRFDALVGRLDRDELVVVAVDMPIGLPEIGPRRCDVQARALLGSRRSTVFPAPVRATLGAADYDDARSRSRAASGRALSIQAFHLLPKIAELDRLVSPDRDDVVESHPELAFCRLAGGAPLAAKRTPDGRRQRLHLVRPVLDGQDGALLARQARAPVIDVLDAVALVATARHLALGAAQLLGDGERDRTGRAMRVAW